MFKPIENFERIIENGHYYVDKTLMIKDIINSDDIIQLYTHPRRFGKTLNMSILISKSNRRNVNALL